LSKPNTVVLTKSTAEKYFGQDDPMGKEIVFSDSIKLLVSGIIEDSPTNTHFNTISLLLSRHFENSTVVHFQEHGFGILAGLIFP
jgi:putative ABC transport system permease protein